MSGTTVEDISAWFDKAKAEGGTYMLVICDTYDWEDYPVTVHTDEDCLAKYNNPGEMQKVMEVYDLRKDKQQQLAELRVFNLPVGGVNEKEK